MAYTVDQIASSEKVVEGRFTGSNGSVNPYSKGLIFENDKIVSSSFGYSPAYTPTDENILEFCRFGADITTCFEGPLLKLWWDSEGEHHLSTTNKLDCRNSHWGNKDEKFGELFYNNGGTKFIELCEDHDNTHHFMIMTPSLVVTSELNLKDNDCIVVYLGSMTKQGYFECLGFGEGNFQEQWFNTIPTKKELDGKILYPFVWHINDVEYYLDFIKNILKYGYSTYEGIFEPLNQEEKFKGVDMRVIESYFGSPVIIRTPQGIVKFVPSSYEKKCSLLGNTPNIKLLVYNIMDACRPKKDAVLEYFENYDFLFVPDWEFLESLKDSQDVKHDIIMKYRELGTTGFMDAKNARSNDTRERNLLLILLLCLPQSKSKIAIEAYEDYLKSQIKIKNFIKLNLTKIIEGKYDESLENEKVIARMKDMCSRSSDFASKNKNNKSYNQNLEFSLKGLLNNERGSSLYKINKVLSKFI